jgi:hypothetical protein
MKRSLVASTLLVLMSGASAASAQNLVIGATYKCTRPVPDFVLERCDDEYCHVQILNRAAPDGKGAALDMYVSMMADRMKGCTPSGGSSTMTVPDGRAAPAPRQAQPNPAYVAGAGAGVKFNPPPGSAAGTQLVANSYNCTAFIGTPPNGRLATMPGFSILAGNRYRHGDGSTGTVTTSGASLTFHGGALDGQMATYDAGASGRGSVHLYNERRTRTVIDCDGHS